MDQSCIYWFSGTGNSLYAAKRLSADLDNMPLVQITNEAPSEAVGGAGTKIGFVFPSYYSNLPRAVRAFVEKLEIKPDTYIFAIVPKGGLAHGSTAELDKALKAKGLRLHYGKVLHMCGNYVINYNPADPNEIEKKLDQVDARLGKYAAEIAAGKQSVSKLPVTANNLYNDIEQLDTAFTATDSCTGCGQCTNICPVQNIQLENGKPVWLHHCEHCVACISWCPAKAIEYGDRTQSRRRYRNPRISVEEIYRK